MSEKVQQMAPEILGAIKSSKKILLHFHPSPDTDGIGSSLAMAHVLKQLNKDFVVIGGDSPIPRFAQAFPNHDWILAKNFTQINQEEFDLFLVLDSGSLERITRIAPVHFSENLKIIVIDHHISSRSFGQINLIGEDYPAVCQLLYDLFSIWQVEITKEIATCLILGIYGDTGGLKYPGTTFRTLFIISELAKVDPDFSTAILKVENSNGPKQIEFMGLGLSLIKTYFSGQVAVSEIPFVELQKRNITEVDRQGIHISGILSSVIEWPIGISMTETELRRIYFGFRSRDGNKFDVSKIAVAVGNGGGHKAAAGTTITASFDKAKKILLEAIAKVYPQLGQP